MSNKEIYQKTLGFSVRRFFYDLLAFVVLAGACALGFFIAEKSFDLGLVGLLIGLVVGIVVIAVFLRYVSYTYKAGQIAMMTEGITTGSLPDDVIGGGKAAVKSRFATVAIYFAATGIIKGIFNQIGRGITAIGSSVGGDTGETVGSVISAVVQTIVAYLCDCCLGWVFFRKGVNAGKATCEGAVLFFKHGKTFAKNMGRVFGMGIASYIRKKRMEAACNMLRYSDIPYAEIAQILAFSSQSHFIQVFKADTGMTPHEYRNSASAE